MTKYFKALGESSLSQNTKMKGGGEEANKAQKYNQSHSSKQKYWNMGRFLAGVPLDAFSSLSLSDRPGRQQIIIIIQGKEGPKRWRGNPKKLGRGSKTVPKEAETHCLVTSWGGN